MGLLLLAAAGAGAQEAGTGQSGAAGGSEKPVLRVARVAGAAPVVDGGLDDAVWAGAARADGFVQLRPRPGAPASQPTEVLVFLGEDALYVGARLRDARPDSIVARLGRCDEPLHSDWFWIGIDSYHDRRTAFLFGINPRGVQRDAVVYNDEQEDTGWDAVWGGAARVDAEGWTAELRIPLSQLRFGTGDVWGVNFRRDIARADETAYWAPTPPDAPGLVSHFGELHGLEGVRAPSRLELRPYSVARLTRTPGDATDPFYRRNDVFGALGADLKLGLASNLTLTATINPDFGQVEADPAEVNLTAYESYLPEKRPFFTEGGDIFDGGWPRLFYSRRIGRSPRGGAPGTALHVDAPRASTILSAAKLTGKTAGGWTVGVMEAVTAEESARYVDAAGGEGRAVVEPLTNHAVARVSREFEEGRSAVDGMLTAVHRRPTERLGFLPSAAYAGSVGARRRFGGGDYEADARLSGSHVRGAPESIRRLQLAPARAFQRPDAEHLEYDSTRTTLSGAAASAGVARVGGGHWRWRLSGYAYTPGFEINDLGFHLWTDEVRQFATVEYIGFRPGRLFRRWEVGATQVSEWTFGGERKDAALHVAASAQLHSHWRMSGWAMRHTDGVETSALRGGPALYRPGRIMGGVSVGTDPRRTAQVRVGSTFDVLDRGEGESYDVNATLSLRAADRLDVSLRPGFGYSRTESQYVLRRSVGGAERYLLGALERTTASLTARASYTVSPALSLQLYAQPFASAGDYERFRRVARPRAERLDERLPGLGASEIAEETGADGGRRYRYDADGDGVLESGFADPDFNVQELRSTAVLRWEYRPGSTLFLVWSHGRAAKHGTGRLDAGRELDHLLAADGSDVLQVKASFWLGF